MEPATEAIEPGDDCLVHWGHLQWLHLRMIDLSAMRDLNRVWETVQAMRAVIPTIRAAATQVLNAQFFPIEWTGAGHVSTVLSPPQEWTDIETRELFGEMDEKAARSRAQSLLNLLKVMEPYLELAERACCEQWYAAGRARFAKLAPDAPALQLAMAGVVTLSIFLQLPATEPEGGQVALGVTGEYLDAGFKYLTEPDIQVMLASSAEENFAAINAVHAILVHDIANRTQVAA
jgi:hypothetical protein